eukprot:6506679-Alexandrium_andersonii.AAC.1
MSVPPVRWAGERHSPVGPDSQLGLHPRRDLLLEVDPSLLRDPGGAERHRLVPPRRPVLERGLLLQADGFLGRVPEEGGLLDGGVEGAQRAAPEM